MAAHREACLAAALEEVLLGHMEWEEQGLLELVEMVVHGEEAPLEEASMASLRMTNPLEAVLREG